MAAKNVTDKHATNTTAIYIRLDDNKSLKMLMVVSLTKSLVISEVEFKN